MSILDDLATWAAEEDEEPSSPKDVKFFVVRGTDFKAKGHGTWAWKKGMRANRGAKYVVDPQDETHVWFSPTHRARRVDKARMVDEAIAASRLVTMAEFIGRR